MEKVKLNITGMSCSACSSRVEKTLQNLEGVKEPYVNIAMGNASFELDTGITSLEKVISEIEKSGYGASESDEKKNRFPAEDDAARLKKEFIFGAILSAPLLSSMFFMIAGVTDVIVHEPLFQIIFAAPVQFIIGLRFYKNSFRGLRAGAPGMDLLIAIGTSAAFALSVYNGFVLPASGAMSGDLYFEASAVIITLVILGKYFEASAKGKTTEAIRKLMDIRPATAELFSDGKTTTIPVEQIRPGDIIQVRAGSRIPADGTITSGITTVDESMMTGEPLPSDKKTGDNVSAGTINMYGSFLFEARRVGEETFLSKIIRSIEEAQMTKPPIQRLADRISAVFVPVILVIAAVSITVWFFSTGDIEKALLTGVSVLVIACPCALGLATPTAIMTGTGKGAEFGILIKNGESLEKSSHINTIVLDKTGTLTAGHPSVDEVSVLEGFSREDAILLAASASGGSEHPISLSICKFASENGIEAPQAETFRQLPGRGISAVVEGSEILLGSADLMKENSIDISAFSEPVLTGVYLAVDGAPAAAVYLTDKIKPDTAKAVASLKEMGIESIMATGDSEAAARETAKTAGIDIVYSGIMPENKKEIIMDLQKKGRITAMAGDGINDAPALAQADTGIALASGSDIAVDAADITLVGGDIAGIKRAVNLSKITMKKIKQNLFWAFIYNSIGVPFAAFGLLNPMVAAAAMALSSVSVVTNSLTLKGIKKDEL